MKESKAHRVAFLGMLFALAITLSFLESLVTPLLGLMPAMKLGLSNIVVMYALLYTGKKQAFALVALKALFAFFTRGVTAGLLSFCGGTVSFVMLCLLLLLPVPITGYVFSAAGAVAHNLGQLVGAAVLLSSTVALAYAPVMLISGLIVGYGTYLVFHAVEPYITHFKADGKK